MHRKQRTSDPHPVKDAMISSARNTAIILAAGFGKRMGAATRHTPKPLLRCGEATLIDRIIADFKGQNIDYFAINTHYKAEQLQEHFSGRTDVSLFHEPRLLDTGGSVAAMFPSVLNSLPEKQDPQKSSFLVANCDSLFLEERSTLPPVSCLHKAFDSNHMDALLLLVPLSKANPFPGAYGGAGDFVAAPELSGQNGPQHSEKTAFPLTRLHNQQNASPDNIYVFTGMQILTPQAFAHCPPAPFSLNAIYDKEIGKKRLFGIVYSGTWAHLGTEKALSSFLKNF